MTRATGPTAVDVSICMVSIDCWDVLQPCLASLRAAAGRDVSYEVIVVDNASTDGTPDRIAERYPAVKLVRNERNAGFSCATNQAIARSRGRYLLWLNPDTVLRPGAVATLVDFLDRYPRAGVVGPKVLNADGTFQPQCRRGLPTPEAALAYMLGLHRRWPEHPVAGQYLLTYLAEDERSRVTAVSGCCLLTRRQVLDEVGPIDEAIFGFGEDIDWCVSAQKAGWEVWYEPASTIMHLKGRGGVHVRPYHKVCGIHQGMWIFYRKHLAAEYNPLVTALVATGIGLSFAASLWSTWIDRMTRRRRQRGHAAALATTRTNAPAEDAA